MPATITLVVVGRCRPSPDRRPEDAPTTRACADSSPHGQPHVRARPAGHAVSLYTLAQVAVDVGEEIVIWVAF